jgi:phosphonate transport system substrate-binding protein
MFLRPCAAALLAAAMILSGCGPRAQGDEAQMREVRMAVRSMAVDPRLARRWSAYKAVFERTTGLPVKLYQSSDYNGVIQAFASNQVDVADLPPDSYANVDAQIGNLAAPILAVREAEGGMGYYSAVVVKKDSPYKSLRDLKGHSLVYPDFNSTSGYLFPRAKMREEGFDPDTSFSKTGISGGHTQSVMAVANGQYDAAVVYMTGGTPQTGFTNGAVYRLAQLGLIKPGDFRIIWTAGPIPNTALAVRTDRPQWFIDAVRGAAAAMPYDDPQTWNDIGQLDGSTFATVDRSFYQSIIKLRADEIAHRRGQK